MPLNIMLFIIKQMMNAFEFTDLEDRHERK